MAKFDDLQPAYKAIIVMVAERLVAINQEKNNPRIKTLKYAIKNADWWLCKCHTNATVRFAIEYLNQQLIEAEMLEYNKKTKTLRWRIFNILTPKFKYPKLTQSKAL